MKKAQFIPMEKKNEHQVLQDIALTPQERVWNMFELMEALSFLQKSKPIEVAESRNCIILKRRNDGKLQERP